MRKNRVLRLDPTLAVLAVVKLLSHVATDSEAVVVAD